MNKVILLGEISGQPQVSEASGRCELTFILVTAESLPKSELLNLHREYHDVRLAAHIAEAAKKIVSEGRLLYIEGKIKTEVHTSAQGKRVYHTYILAHSCEAV